MLGSRLNISSACLGSGDLSTNVKADAKARAKAEVDGSCRDKTQAQALAQLMLWSEKTRFNQQVFSGGSGSTHRWEDTVLRWHNWLYELKKER